MWLYRLNCYLIPLMRCYWNVRLLGDVEAIPRRGPLLLAANHSSVLDPWLVGMVFPRPVRYLIVKRWYERNGIWKAAFASFGTIPVEPGNFEVTFSSIQRALSRGDAVGIFPEGRLSTDGRIQRFRSGIARIAARSGVPVLPVGVRGGFETLPHDRRIPRPTAIEIHVGRPMEPPSSGPAEEPSPVDFQPFLATLAREVSRLAGQGYLAPETSESEGFALPESTDIASPPG